MELAELEPHALKNLMYDLESKIEIILKLVDDRYSYSTEGYVDKKGYEVCYETSYSHQDHNSFTIPWEWFAKTTPEIQELVTKYKKRQEKKRQIANLKAKIVAKAAVVKAREKDIEQAEAKARRQLELAQTDFEKLMKELNKLEGIDVD